MTHAKETFKNLLDLEKPVLTEKLAPKLAPFSKIIYVVALGFIALGVIGSLGILISGNLSLFLATLLMLVAEFAIIRMFCEYLASTAPKSKK